MYFHKIHFPANKHARRVSYKTKINIFQPHPKVSKNRLFLQGLPVNSNIFQKHEAHKVKHIDSPYAVWCYMRKYCLFLLLFCNLILTKTRNIYQVVLANLVVLEIQSLFHLSLQAFLLKKKKGNHIKNISPCFLCFLIDINSNYLMEDVWVKPYLVPHVYLGKYLIWI